MSAITRTMQGLTQQVQKNHTQIKALPTSGVFTVIPAPGAGRVIFPIGFVASLSPWAADYTNINGGATFVMKIGTLDLKAFFAGAAVSVSGLLAQGQASYIPGIGYDGGFYGTAHSADIKLADYANLPLTCTIANAAAGNFTGGDAANVLTILAYYNIYKAAA